MATISGRVVFDRDRSATISGGDSGLANIPVVLQNVDTAERLTVLTDADGNYAFLNVPNGNYRIVESYGASGGVPTPGNFSTAVVGSIPQGVNPPIGAASNPPPGSTNLDSVTPDTLLVTVTGPDFTNQNFLNGPVIYTPIQVILDPCSFISGENLIQDADNGTFGSFPPGTPANTGAPTEPYPGVTPDFTYVLPNPDAYTPAGGQYTVQNIMNNALSEVIGAWWRIADHTAGNETGRMMIVNGFNPGAVFFQTVVPVRPYTNYLFSAWILNLFRVTGYPNPELGVLILDQNGDVLYSATLGILIPVNVNAPEWRQIGSAINSQNNTSLTVEFVSEGPEVIGNDYAIDDVAFQEIQEPVFIPVKTVDRSTANVGETVRFTVTLTNTCESPLTNVFFQDIVPNGLAFVPGSVTINEVSDTQADPDIGFPLPNVPGGETVTVSFSAMVTAIPAPNPALNSASIRYEYTPVEGGIPGVFHVVSNYVPVQVEELADLSVVKTASPSPVDPGSVLTYTVKISNAGPSDAENVELADNVSATLINAEFSTDDGATWYPWVGPYLLGRLPSGQSQTILIRGTVDPAANESIINTATVLSSTPDPDLSNNSDTVVTPVNELADLSVVKLGSPNPAIPGEWLTYTVTIFNAGPSTAVNALLTDAVPAALTDVQYSLNSGGTFQPWPGSLPLGNLAPNTVVQVLLRGIVSASAVGTIDNTATVSSDTPDPDLNNNQSTDTTPVAASADLAVTKSGSPSPVPAGGVLTYAVIVSNNGPSDAQNVTLTDSIPPELAGVEYSLDGGATFQAWPGSVDLGVLAAGGSRTVLIRGTVGAGATGSIINTAVVESPTPDPDPDNNQFTEITPIDTAADLSVVKTGSPSPVFPGQPLIFSITITNDGPDPAVNTVLTDAVPATLTDVEYSVDGGATWSPWTGSYAAGTLVSGAVQTVLLRGIVSPTAAGTIDNTATVSSDTPDPNPDNNTSTALIPVGISADLSVSKRAFPVPVEAGGILTYTITVYNAGPNAAQNVELADLIPAEILNPEFAVQGGTVFAPWISPYNIGTLGAGESFVVTIRGTVNPSAPVGSIENTAAVESTTPDPDPDNNTATEETPVTVSADVAVIKTAGSSPAIPGQTFSYTITVTNGGPSDAQGVILIDAVPAVLRDPEFSVDGGITFFPWVSPYTLGTLAAGASRAIVLRGTLSASATGEIINTAVAESTTPDPNPDNNISTDITPIQPSADISVVKTASPNPVLAGERLTYTLLVSNAGPSASENVVLSDQLPAELENAEISVDGGVTWAPFSGIYPVGRLDAGAVVELIIRAEVSSFAAGSLTNTAVVSSDTPDPNPDNNTFIVVTPVAPSADLSISKAAAPDPVRPGDVLTYTVTVFNNGPADAQNVVVLDSVPSTLIGPEYSVDGGGTFQPWPGSLPLGTLAAGSTRTILLRGTVSLLANGSIINTALVSSTTPDPDPNNNTDTVETPLLLEEADLSIQKTACPNPVYRCQHITYTVTVSNAGPAPAEQVVITDRMPRELCDAIYSVDNGQTWEIWTGCYTVGTLAEGASVTLRISGFISACAKGRICNTARVSSLNADPNPRNNTVCASVCVIPRRQPPKGCW
ncbi:DUF11 domain-containing protein [Zongyangia hominis]|uniref:DUF11 domain-containing protein n=1 Tax=Zongyangia hominis TaxID=2763677 RepID=A0A926EDG8_9FIRM|nr:DUF11 domain-containing protein [Zongyangia hominis]MBC8570189.1 DUF11 domain-containing protein [Zongyangia hominis]